MGTCIGIGMNWAMKRSGIHFDTIIIDEAGKANLAETTVPMELGDKFILVGDNKQLPPYMDKEEISEFILKDPTKNLSQKDVENAIRTSLFEDFLQDKQFPQESKILLNYQYRMNPEIGEYISDLFYDGQLNNGIGTENQVCQLDNFPDAVTFIDTSTKKLDDNGDNVAFEKGDGISGWYNPYEIQIIQSNILPNLVRAKISDPNISIGIITPYRKQRLYLLDMLKNTQLNNCVHTIDSIQGTEFDIVVVSLVRAFDTTARYKKVGFLDDMRRLNVALSRAKKKLIIIGNLDTLTNENAHFKYDSDCEIKPIDVFRNLKAIKNRTEEKTTLALLREMIKEGKVKEGDVFKNCKWFYEDRKYPIVEISVDESKLRFPLRKDDRLKNYTNEGENIDVKFLGIGSNGKAMFEYIIPIARQIEDGMLTFFKAFPQYWSDIDERIMLFRYEDGSESYLPINPRINNNSFFYNLLNSANVKDVSLNYWDGFINLDRKPYLEFQEKYKIGDKVEVEVIDYFETRNSQNEPRTLYIVRFNKLYGVIPKRKNVSLTIGDIKEVSIYKIDYSCITFSL